MAEKKVDAKNARQEALTTALAQIEQKYGKGSVMRNGRKCHHER